MNHEKSRCGNCLDLIHETLEARDRCDEVEDVVMLDSSFMQLDSISCMSSNGLCADGFPRICDCSGYQVLLILLRGSGETFKAMSARERAILEQGILEKARQITSGQINPLLTFCYCPPPHWENR